MSYFYLNPVVGNIQLHILEECVYQRFKYLLRLCNAEETPFCEYLIEGSPLDTIGHFVLGLLVRHSDQKSLSDFVNQSEEKLFMKRIESADINDIRLLCKTILKSIRGKSDSYTRALSVFCRQLIIKHIAGHVFDKNHDINCVSYKIYLHFTHCLPFISNRSVEIQKGIACINCGLWKRLFVILFRTNLYLKFEQYNADEHVRFDPRYKDILTKIINSFFMYNIQNKLTLFHHDDVDKEMLLFPLCMNNLHDKLRINHRLPHDDRFRYSLFLKEIGLPLQESIHFWEKEYSKPCGQGSVCSHNWHKDEKRYVYSLRHLYGLEGSRKNYRMTSCTRLQSKTCESGCAFKNSNENHLRKLTQSKILNRDDWNIINMYQKAGSYGKACFYYRNIILTHLFQDMELDLKISHIFSPVDYYLEFKKILQS